MTVPGYRALYVDEILKNSSFSSVERNSELKKLVRDMKFDAVITSQMNKEKPWKYERICWGVKKVYALDEWAKQNKIIPDVVRSYSDSKSDMPLMEIADEQVWINRKTGMRK